MKVAVCVAKQHQAKLAQRYRVGMRFSHEPTIIDVSAEQLAALKGDEYLSVVEAPSAAPKAAPKKTDEK